MSSTPTIQRRVRHRARALLLGPLLLLAAGLAATGVSARTAPEAQAMPAATEAGTGSVSGTVRNNAGTPVAGAHVVIVELGRQAITNASGAYNLAGVPFGDYEIRFSTVCKDTLSRSLTVDGAETQDLSFFNNFLKDSFGHACRPTSFALLTGQTILPLSGDDQSVGVNLPFGFPFYGITKNVVNVSTNGYLTFGTDSRARDNLDAGAADTPFSSILVFWDDLVVDANASVSTTTVGSAPNRVFMVEWDNVTFFDAAGSRISFQVQLFENGGIEMGWRDIDGTQREQAGSATIGIRNGATGPANDALSASFDEPAIVDGHKIEFRLNDLPVARAGADQKVGSGKGFTLDGSGSTDDGGSSNLVFQWQQIAGPASTILDPKKAKTTVAGQAGPKTFTYRLTVMDQFGRASSDDVTITVSAPK